MTAPYYVLNVNDGIDTLHKNPREECNVDDMDGRQVIDEATYLAKKRGGFDKLCRHCEATKPEPGDTAT